MPPGRCLSWRQLPAGQRCQPVRVEAQACSPECSSPGPAVAQTQAPRRSHPHVASLTGWQASAAGILVMLHLMHGDPAQERLAQQALLTPMSAASAWTELPDSPSRYASQSVWCALKGLMFSSHAALTRSQYLHPSARSPNQEQLAMQGCRHALCTACAAEICSGQSPSAPACPFCRSTMSSFLVHAGN